MATDACPLIPDPLILDPWYACLYRLPRLSSQADHLRSESSDRETPPNIGGLQSALVELAQDFSPRFEIACDDLITIDISGLERLLGAPRAIGEELRRSAAARGLLVHVAIAATRTAAMVLAHARPGLTVVDRGREADALAPVAIAVLENVASRLETSLVASATFGSGYAPVQCPEHIVRGGGASATSGSRYARAQRREGIRRGGGAPREVIEVMEVFQGWGLKTLGDLAALPSVDLAARLGQQGVVWQSIARGQDVRPLVPSIPDERFEASIELDWPIEGLEPLSFVLTRLLEPLSTHLERRDRGAAALHVTLGLVKCYEGAERAGLPPIQPHFHQISLQLPAPMREVRALRTLILLDLESHPPPAAIERVGIVIDPTPGRVLQHRLFTRANPTPEQLSTLLARLTALMGQDRHGQPALVDSHRPGAFAMLPFAVAQVELGTQFSATFCSEYARARRREGIGRGGGAPRGVRNADGDISRESDAENLIPQALRRCRHPVPARVAVDGITPVFVTTDRRGFGGGRVLACTGPWRTSGEWWADGAHESGRAGGAGRAGRAGKAGGAGESGGSGREIQTHPTYPAHLTHQAFWHREEWDISLSDGAFYRIFRDCATDGWFIDAIFD